MRIAVIHSFYRSSQPSGENTAVIQEIDALRRFGMQVHEIFRFTDDLQKGNAYKLKSAARVATGFDFSTVLEGVNRVKPDIVHVHNVFPNFGSRWLARVEVPIVTTVHNFRASCANGLLYRDGHVCLDCPQFGSRSSLKHDCYQDSKMATLPLAFSTKGGAKSNTLFSASQAIITQSNRVQDFMIGQGVPKNKLHLIPGFVEQRHSGASEPPNDARFVFVGRNTPEKGLRELLTIWPDKYRLDVIGADGTEFPAKKGSNIQFLGIRSRSQITNSLQDYTALVFAGRAWEGAYPLVVREALEAGLPVIALAGSGAADLIAEIGDGLSYRDGSKSELENCLFNVISAKFELRQLARQFYSERLSEIEWATSLQKLYLQLA